MTTLYPPADQIKTLQERKLRELLEYVGKNSPFYRELFREYRIDITDVRTLEDLTRIPVTGKPDLQTIQKMVNEQVAAKATAAE